MVTIEVDATAPDVAAINAAAALEELAGVVKVQVDESTPVPVDGGW
jgi:hypothetical protein